MSDSENVDIKKRGRGPIVGEKRRVETPPKKDDKIVLGDGESGETPAKRGRGRPKGSTKKNGGVVSGGGGGGGVGVGGGGGGVNKQNMKKSNIGFGKGRGRPTKKKDDSTEDELEENDETEENDEENETGSD